MIYVHGAWIPTESISKPGYFFVWGETSLSSSIAKEKKSNEKKEIVSLHPFVCHAFALKSALFTGKNQGSLDPTSMLLKRKTVVMRLPSSDNEPLASSSKLRQSLNQPESPDDINLSSYRVEGFIIPGTIFIEAMQEITDSSLVQVELSHSFTFWSHIAQCSLELLRQGSWYPALVDNGEKAEALREYSGQWKVYTVDKETRSYIHRLASAMPSVCKAVTLIEGLSSKDVVRDCIQVSVDQFIKKEIEEYPTPLLPKITGLTKSLTVEGRWFHSLVVSRPETIRTSQVKGISQLAEDVKHWIHPLGARSENTGYQIGFRLEPPKSNDDGTWMLRVHLQSLIDQDHFISSDELKNEQVPEKIRSRLIGDLDRSAKIDPLLEGFRRAEALSIPLRPVEAYTFLSDIAEKLIRHGFHVLLPTWWKAFKQRRSPVQLRFHLEPHAESDSKGIGLATLVRTRWDLLLGDDPLTEEDWQTLLQSQTPLVNIRDQWVVFHKEQAEHIKKRIQWAKRESVIPLSKALHLPLMDWNDEYMPALNVTWEKTGWIDEFLKSISGQRLINPLTTPKDFQGVLRPYQQLGFEWIHTMRQWGLGALLADDMGLGKTIQWIAYLLYCKQEGELKHCSLLICPTSVAGNWESELRKFAPTLRVHVHHGPDRMNASRLAEEKDRYDVMITTYGLVQKDFELFSSLPWDVITLDEAQAIKNIGTKQSLAVRGLQGSHRIALTGTPIENRLTELWSIMDFLNPGYLGSISSFRTKYALPIERSAGADESKVFNHLIRPFLLRRVKTDPEVIRDLPEKQEIKVYCPLTREQAALYEAVVRDMMNRIEQSKGMERRGNILAALTRLKQVCNHPAHYLKDGSEIGRRSGKVNILMERLENVLEKGERALIFTQYTAMGDQLKGWLEKTLSCEVLYLHGSVPKAKRDLMVERFQQEEGPPLFILSLKAGGIGLNLTKANHVFHFDRWWNPAVEDQATDRAFRIGQKRNVFVHKLISTGTLEERIDGLLEQKRTLAETIIGNGEGWITELSAEDLQDIFTLRQKSFDDEE
jgi:SNF2 family DNA or RNA helicase